MGLPPPGCENIAGTLSPDYVTTSLHLQNRDTHVKIQRGKVTAMPVPADHRGPAAHTGKGRRRVPTAGREAVRRP